LKLKNVGFQRECLPKQLSEQVQWSSFHLLQFVLAMAGRFHLHKHSQTTNIAVEHATVALLGRWCPDWTEVTLHQQTRWINLTQQLIECSTRPLPPRKLL